jgi:hypothetical protein
MVVRKSSRNRKPTEAAAALAADKAAADAKLQAEMARLQEEEARLQEVEDVAPDLFLRMKMEQPQNFEEIGVPHGRAIQGVNAYKDRMGAIIKTLFPQQVLDEWGKPGRAIYEGSSPQTQCTNTIPKATNNTPCWLCGIKVDLSKTLFKTGMKPICEHVLPIAQAVFFLGLYSTRIVRPSEGMPNIPKQIIKLEYDWSHEVCNGEKSNIVLIKEVTRNDGTPSWAPDTDAITGLLNKIKNSARTDSGTLKELISNTPGWLGKRETAIFERVKKVTDFINRPAEPGFGNLTQLAGWASLVDPTSMTDAFLSQIDVSLPDNVTSATKKRRLSQGARRKRNRKTRRIRKH